jgi:hypothetical protein
MSGDSEYPHDIAPQPPAALCMVIIATAIIVLWLPVILAIRIAKMTRLEFPITNEEAVAMDYTRADMAVAKRALRVLWRLVDDEARARRAHRARRAR